MEHFQLSYLISEIQTTDATDVPFYALRHTTNKGCDAKFNAALTHARDAGNWSLHAPVQSSEEWKKWLI